jgi:1,2-diacylglycerol 3-beta-galactosyltransferase
MSDTGGGHRAAAEAIRDALIEQHGPDEIQATLVDVYRQMPWPGSIMPDLYPKLVNNAVWLWETGYRISNNLWVTRAVSRITYWGASRELRQMVRDNPADIVVCCHSIVARTCMDAFKAEGSQAPFITVVTDLVTTPFFWYDQRADFCIVPSEYAFERGLRAGLWAEQMRVIGLPVHPNFNRSLTDKASARADLGWDPTMPTIMMVSGGDGMGPLFATAEAIVEKQLGVQIVVIAGRNKALKAKLDAVRSEWERTGKNRLHTYGFVTDMPRLMAAADMLVTKAGPATISEACIAGLPIILFDAIPGQEDGNIAFVVEQGIGAYAPGPYKVADVVERWTAQGPDALHARAERARRASSPDAVWQIADEIWKYAPQNRT